MSLLRVQDLTMAWGERIIQRGLNFEVTAGEIFVIMGASGSGKSSLMRHLVGLQEPHAGQVWLQDTNLYACSDEHLSALRRKFGVMFQSSALWSSMTVGENLMLPLKLFTSLPERAMMQRARFKLALVGLDDCFDALPAELSGGMKKRVAIARSLMLDPDLLYLDEPASGLDPINARRLDELLLSIRQHLGTTIVLITHSVDSIFAVADRALFLDDQSQTMTALDSPRQLEHTGPARVQAFLQRSAE
jgi:phospholipid/cholesterol/gamma-HCH transport system ATP-binding protein